MSRTGLREPSPLQHCPLRRNAGSYAHFRPEPACEPRGVGIGDHRDLHRVRLALAGDVAVAAVGALGRTADTDLGCVNDGALTARAEVVDDVSERMQPDTRPHRAAPLGW